MVAGKNKINTFIVLYITIPFLALFTFLIFVYWTSLTKDNRKRIRFLAEEAELGISTGINTQIGIGTSIAKLPVVVDFFEKREIAGETIPKETTLADIFNPGQKRTARTTNSEEIMRLAQFNPVTERLRKFCADNPGIESVIIGDRLGEISVSTSKPPASDISNTEWWKAGIKSSKDDVIYNGINPDGSFNTIFPIWSDVRAKPLAVVLVNYDVGKIIDKMNYKITDEREAILIQSKNEIYYKGSASVIARFRDPIIKHIKESFVEAGWFNGARYELLVLKKPAAFKQPLRVTAIREEPFLPQDQVMRISVAVSTGFLAWVILQFIAGRAARKIIAGNSETLAAGDILLRLLRTAGDTSGFQKYKDQTHQQVQEEFRTYLKTYKETVLENVEHHEYELKRDMELATEFQMAYVNRPYPSVPKNPTPNRLKLNFHHCYEPALALGGDFFDIYNIAPEVGGVFIADVMGHGARSALITANLRAMLSDLLPQGRNARNVMAEMNKSFYSLLESVNTEHPIFASAFYFVGDMTARAATFSTAGHPAPYHIHRKGNVIHRLQVQAPHGAALGIDPKEEYTGGSCRLVAGDVFIFFTDGIYEAFNSMGEEFGLQRMERALYGLIHKNCQEIVDGLVTAVKEFAGDEPLHDDICVIGVEVTEGH